MITTKIPFLERVPQETQNSINNWYIFSIITISTILLGAGAVSSFSYYILKNKQKTYKELSINNENVETSAASKKQNKAQARLLVKTLEQSMEMLPKDCYFTSFVYELNQIKIEGNARTIKLVSSFIDSLQLTNLYKQVKLTRIEQNNKKDTKKSDIKFEIHLAL